MECVGTLQSKYRLTTEVYSYTPQKPLVNLFVAQATTKMNSMLLMLHSVLLTVNCVQVSKYEVAGLPRETECRWRWLATKKETWYARCRQSYSGYTMCSAFHLMASWATML